MSEKYVADAEIDRAFRKITGKTDQKNYEETIKGMVERLRNDPEELERLVRMLMPDSDSLLRTIRSLIREDQDK